MLSVVDCGFSDDEGFVSVDDPGLTPDEVDESISVVDPADVLISDVVPTELSSVEDTDWLVKVED